MYGQSCGYFIFVFILTINYIRKSKRKSYKSPKRREAGTYPPLLCPRASHAISHYPILTTLPKVPSYWMWAMWPTHDVHKKPQMFIDSVFGYLFPIPPSTLRILHRNWVSIFPKIPHSIAEKSLIRFIFGQRMLCIDLQILDMLIFCVCRMFFLWAKFYFLGDFLDSILFPSNLKIHKSKNFEWTTQNEALSPIDRWVPQEPFVPTSNLKNPRLGGNLQVPRDFGGEPKILP